MKSTTTKPHSHLNEIILTPRPEDVLKVVPLPKYTFDDSGRGAEFQRQVDIQYSINCDALEKHYVKINRWPSDQEYRRLDEQSREECEKAYQDDRMKAVLWDRSERILNILRAKPGIGKPPSTAEARKLFASRVKLRDFPEANRDSILYIGPYSRRHGDDRYAPEVATPNEYFQETHPKLLDTFGYAFHAVIHPGERRPMQMPRTGQQSRPPPPRPPPETIIGINYSFFAAYLGGDKRLTHDVVYSKKERTFYFYDIVADRYLPTTEDRLRILLSLTLQERAEGQPESVAVEIIRFSVHKYLIDQIMMRARALLAADQDFFDDLGDKCKHTDKPGEEFVKDQHEHAVAHFVKRNVLVDENELLPLSEALTLITDFYVYNAMPLPPTRELKQYVEQAILTSFGISIRNDLKSASGKHVRSWKGLKLKLSPAELSEIKAKEDLGQVSGQSESVRAAPDEPPTIGQIVDSIEHTINNVALAVAG